MARPARLALIAATALVAGCGRNDEPEVVDARTLAEQTVEAALADPSEWVRAESVRLLALSGDPSVEPRLAQLLADQSGLVRGAALEALLATSNRSAAEAALRALLQGTAEQKLRLLDLVLRHGSADLQREAALQALRDTDAAVRSGTLARIATSRSVALTREQIDRLLGDSSAAVVDETVRFLVATAPDLATTTVLTRLRSSQAATRASGMRLAAALGVPAVWPQMRSMARAGDREQRTMALMALGHLGDPIAEADLRSIVLNGTGSEAGLALEALARIPTDTARQQPLRMMRDARVEVRRAAFRAMAHLEQPLEAFEGFLSDADPAIVGMAVAHVQARDPERAARLLTRALSEAVDPEPLMRALFAASRTADVSALVRAARPQLLQVARSANEGASYLAIRLLLDAEQPSDLMPDVVADQLSPAALYGLLESSIGRDPGLSDLYTRQLEHELFMVRVAASVGIFTLGPNYAPSPSPG